MGNYPGQLVNSPNWRPTQGLFNGALEFDGNDDRVNLGAIDISGNQMTISFWFKADNFNNPEARFISKATGSDSNEHYWMVGTYNRSSLRFRLKSNGSTTTLVSPLNIITIGQWHYVVATYDGSKMRIYRDGQLVASTSKTGNIDVNNRVSVAMGDQPANAGSRPFDGLIDEVKIYGQALTSNQIQTIAEDNSIYGQSIEPAPSPTPAPEPTPTPAPEPTPDPNAESGSIILNWTAPVARVDGTPLAPTEILEYTIYFGTTEGNYTDSFTVPANGENSITVTGLVPGAYYYMAITTRDIEGLESAYLTFNKKQAQF